MSARVEAARRRKEKLLARGGDRLAAITGALPPTEPAIKTSADASTAAGVDAPECSSPSEPDAIREHPASLGGSQPSAVAGSEDPAAAISPRDPAAGSTQAGSEAQGQTAAEDESASAASVAEDAGAVPGVRRRARGGEAMLAKAAREAKVAATDAPEAPPAVPAAALLTTWSWQRSAGCTLKATAVLRLLLAVTAALLLSENEYILTPSLLAMVKKEKAASGAPVVVFLLLEVLLLASAWLILYRHGPALARQGLLRSAAFDNDPKASRASAQHRKSSWSVWGIVSGLLPAARLKEGLANAQLLAALWKQLRQDLAVFFLVLIMLQGATMSPGSLDWALRSGGISDEVLTGGSGPAANSAA